MATLSSIFAWKVPWTLVGYSAWGHKESDTTERQTLLLLAYLRNKIFGGGVGEYNWFTVLRWFLLYNKANQPYVFIYLHPPPFPPASVITEHRAELCATQQLPTSYLFYTRQCIYVNATLPIRSVEVRLVPLTVVPLSSTRRQSRGTIV